MNQFTHFQNLKKDVLLTYKKHHPYFEGNWKRFSAQDISNLIDLIEKNVKQSISEKWVYTHLKPETNQKIPRKDMLNILSIFVGYSSWDEYVFEQKKSKIVVVQPATKSKRRIVFWVIVAFFIILFSTFIYINTSKKETIQSIELKEAYSNEKIIDEDIRVTLEKDSTSIPIIIKEGKMEITTSDSAKLTLKSPFYKDKVVVFNHSDLKKEIVLEPNDYAMMLKAFMKSDIKDWETRKRQLHQIVADDAEIIVMLKNNLGAEYFNKQDFILKIIVPSPTVQKMKIVAIENNNNNQIKFVRIIQE